MPDPLMCPPHLLELDLTGRTYVVTGGNSGVGLATVAQLARQGAHVVLACRRPEAGAAAADDLRAEASRSAGGPTFGTIEVAALDLADLASVRAFARAFHAAHDALHGLVNNAGVMNTPEGRTVDGFETQFGTNHLGHVLLTDALEPALVAGAPSRIVAVSSAYHDVAVGRRGAIDLDDPNFERRRYDGWVAYAQSKLANVLHAKTLAKRLADRGVVAVSVHPGWVRTALVGTFLPLWVQNGLLRPLLRAGGMLEPLEGAQATLYALLAPEVADHPGAYFSQRGTYRDRSANRGGWPLRSPNPHAHDEDLAERLDALSRRLVGLAATAPTPGNHP